MPPPLDDAAIAKARGCKLVVLTVAHEDGDDWPEHLAVCPGGNRGAIDLLNDLARADAARSSRVKEAAEACRAWGARFPDQGRETATEIQRFAQRSIRFVDDKFQIFRPCDLTFLRHVGNCVNSARVVMAMALAAGLAARCVPVKVNGEIAHTAAQVTVDGRWEWAEATITARFGEDPFTALARGAVGCPGPDA